MIHIHITVENKENDWQCDDILRSELLHNTIVKAVFIFVQYTCGSIMSMLDNSCAVEIAYENGIHMGGRVYTKNTFCWVWHTHTMAITMRGSFNYRRTVFVFSQLEWNLCSWFYLRTENKLHCDWNPFLWQCAMSFLFLKLLTVYLLHWHTVTRIFT